VPRDLQFTIISIQSNNFITQRWQYVGHRVSTTVNGKLQCRPFRVWCAIILLRCIDSLSVAAAAAAVSSTADVHLLMFSHRIVFSSGAAPGRCSSGANGRRLSSASQESKQRTIWFTIQWPWLCTVR